MIPCDDCGRDLEVERVCRAVTMRCPACGRRYRIREVADRLDADTELLLADHPAVIYD